MITALQQPFFVRSLIAVLLLSIVFPLYGNIVVIRKESNIAHTFAHLGLLGVALGLRFNRPIDMSILGSVVVTVCFLYLLGSSEQTNQVAHNEIGAQFGLVGAILLVSQMSGYRADISSYLFGDILLLGKQDVVMILAIVILCLVLYFFFGRQRYAISLHSSLAKSKNIPVRSYSLLYLFALGLLIGGAMKIIGVLLVSAFLILPSNISKLLATNKLQRNSIGSAACAAISVFALFASRYRDIPSGASIVAGFLIIYLCTQVLIWGTLRK